MNMRPPAFLARLLRSSFLKVAVAVAVLPGEGTSRAEGGTGRGRAAEELEPSGRCGLAVRIVFVGGGGRGGGLALSHALFLVCQRRGVRPRGAADKAQAGASSLHRDS